MNNCYNLFHSFLNDILLKETYLIFKYFSNFIIDTLNHYKLIGLPLIVLLTIIIISAGFTTNSAYAHGKTKVGCLDLGLALITWDQLYYDADEDDLEDFEDVLDDEDIEPNEYEDIIEDNMEDLWSKFASKCEDTVEEEIVEKFEEDVDFNR